MMKANVKGQSRYDEGLCQKSKWFCLGGTDMIKAYVEGRSRYDEGLC